MNRERVHNSKYSKLNLINEIPLPLLLLSLSIIKRF